MVYDEETKCAGGIIVRAGNIVLVSQLTRRDGHLVYSFPKGHVEDGESHLDAAYREIFEECGLAKEHLLYWGDLGSLVRSRGNGSGSKAIHFYLFRTEFTFLDPQGRETRDALWVPIDKVAEMLSHSEDAGFFLRHKSLY